MSKAQVMEMSEADVREIVTPMLRDRLASYDVTDIGVREEEDFDGAFVFRVLVDVARRVPARDLMDVLGDIHIALRQRGENRFVYLSTRRNQTEATDGMGEDVD